MFDSLVDIALTALSAIIASKWNVVYLLTAIPETVRFETGFALYMAIGRLLYNCLAKLIITKCLSKIEIVFFTNQHNIRADRNPEIVFKSDVAKIQLRISVSGKGNLLRKLRVDIPVPEWVDMQVRDGEKHISISDGAYQLELGKFLDKNNKHIAEASASYTVDLITIPIQKDFSYIIKPQVKNKRWYNMCLRITNNTCKIIYSGPGG